MTDSAILVGQEAVFLLRSRAPGAQGTVRKIGPGAGPGSLAAADALQPVLRLRPRPGPARRSPSSASDVPYRLRPEVYGPNPPALPFMITSPLTDTLPNVRFGLSGPPGAL